MFFAENYYGFDDAVFAACKLINILANQELTFSDIIATLPKLFSTSEIRIEVPEENKFQIIEQIKKVLYSQNVSKSPDYIYDYIDVNDLDGVRVTTSKGWWLIRASNTQNILVVRVESKTHDQLEILSKQVIDLLAVVGVKASYDYFV